MVLRFYILPFRRLRFQKSKALKGIDFFESLRDIVSKVNIKSLAPFFNYR